MAQVGLPVYSSDNKNIGQVVEIFRGPDNKVKLIQVEIGDLSPANSSRFE
jgi:ribosomal 30S subunit maturation factor RimM